MIVHYETLTVKRFPDKGAFTNDVIILGARGFGKDDGGRGVGLKMTSLLI